MNLVWIGSEAIVNQIAASRLQSIASVLLIRVFGPYALEVYRAFSRSNPVRCGMRLKPFLLDEWLDTYEHTVEFNLAAAAPDPQMMI